MKWQSFLALFASPKPAPDSALMIARAAAMLGDYLGSGHPCAAAMTTMTHQTPAGNEPRNTEER